MQKDAIINGVIAGLIANFIKLIFAWTGQLLGWLDYMYVHFSLGLFMPKEFITNPLAMLIGYLTDFANGALFGVVLVYIFRLAGMDYALLKGALYGILIHIIVYGGLIQFNASYIITTLPLANLIIFIGNTIFGISAAWFLKKYYHFSGTPAN